MDYTTNLICARKSKKLSQTEVANYLDIPQQQFSRYEKGYNELPIRYLIKLCELYEVSADWILGICTPKNGPKLKGYEVHNTITGEKQTIYFAENVTVHEK